MQMVDSIFDRIVFCDQIDQPEREDGGQWRPGKHGLQEQILAGCGLCSWNRLVHLLRGRPCGASRPGSDLRVEWWTAALLRRYGRRLSQLPVAPSHLGWQVRRQEDPSGEHADDRLLGE